MNKESIISHFIHTRVTDVEHYGGFDTLLKACVDGYRSSGMSSYKFRKFTLSYFPEKVGNTTIRNYIISLYNLKNCAQCDSVFSLDNFRKNLGTATGLQNQCRWCHQANTTKTQPLRQAKRRAIQRQAVPLWYEIDEVRKLYSNCPSGFHVDHIEPLSSDTVCGLHCLANLQYLPELDNLMKGNRRIIWS